MLILKNKKKIFNDQSLIKKDITKIIFNEQTKSERDEYNKMIFYPSSSKEWFNSIYTYSKSYIRSLIVYSYILNKLFRSYCNMLEYKIKILFKRRRDNKIRYSADRIYTNRAELKHTNTKIFITLDTYNKKKATLEKNMRGILTLTKLKKTMVNGKPVFVSNHQNRLLYLLKNNFFIFRKWNTVFFKTTGNLLGYLLISVKKRYIKSYKIPAYNRFLKKISRLQTRVFNTIRSILFNKYIFNTLDVNLSNLGLISLIEKLYSKKVTVSLIDLKKIALNVDLFSSAVALKLRDRQNKAVRILRKAILHLVKIPYFHTLITFDDNMEAMNKNNIINTIKQQVVSGVRFEASGRLTRRLTAMRSVFKYRYEGSLKNIRSSYNYKSSTILRGCAKSNSQYTLINSKTRNGTFGLKGWISSHNIILNLINTIALAKYVRFDKLILSVIFVAIAPILFKWNILYFLYLSYLHE